MISRDTHEHESPIFRAKNMINISEKSFESTIEDILITGLPAKEETIRKTTKNITNFIPGVCRTPSPHTQFKIISPKHTPHPRPGHRVWIVKVTWPA